jgi:hypothetical protein
MFPTIHIKTKAGIEMVIYSFNGRVKFAPKTRYNPMCVNYNDPAFDGTPEECKNYLEQKA